MGADDLILLCLSKEWAPDWVKTIIWGTSYKSAQHPNLRMEFGKNCITEFEQKMTAKAPRRNHWSLCAWACMPMREHASCRKPTFAPSFCMLDSDRPYMYIQTFLILFWYLQVPARMLGPVLRKAAWIEFHGRSSQVQGPSLGVQLVFPIVPKEPTQGALAPQKGLVGPNSP